MIYSFLFISCQHKTADYRETRFKEEMTVNQSAIDSINISKELLDVYNLKISARYLIAMTPQEEPIFNVFELENMEYKGGFGKIGNGPKEFSHPIPSSLRVTNKNDLFLIDNNYAYRIHLPSDTFMTNEHVSFEKICKIPGKVGILNSGFCLNDSIVYGVANHQDKELTSCTPSGKIETIMDYPALINIPPGTKQITIPNLYRSSIAISPDGSKIAFLYYRFPVIRIWDTEKQTLTAQNTIQGIEKYDVKIENNGILPRENFNGIYGTTACSQKYIFAAYLPAKSNENEIHVFDWKGNALYRIKIRNLHFNYFSVSEDNTIYFVSSRTENFIYSYSLKEILG